MCVMLPFLDYVNHQTRESCFCVNLEEQCISLITGHRYEAGEQIFDSYGPKSNAQLLLNYGFALPENPHDSVNLCVKIPDSNGDEELDSERSRLLEGHHLQSKMFFPIRRAQLVPPDMVAFMRIALLAKASDAREESGKPCSAAQPFGLKSEMEVLKTLVRLAQGMIAKYPTTLKEDQELLQTAELPNRRRYALLLRMGEKALLHTFVSEVKERGMQTMLFFSKKAAAKKAARQEAENTM